MYDGAVRAALVLFSLLVACGGPEKHPEPPPAPAFTPTAFVAKVTGTGRPVILIPGLGCPASVWDETVAHLAPHFQTHALTLAGFAGVPPLATTDGKLVAEVRRQILAYIAANHLDHPIIIGHSLGGFLAYWLAETSDQTGPIVVVDNALFIPAIQDAQITAEAAAKDGAELHDMFLAGTDDEYRGKLRAMFSAMTKDPEHLAPTIDAVTRSDRATVANTFSEVWTTDLRPAAASIKVPVLVVLADGRNAPGATAQANTVADHTVKVIPGAKHFVMNDAPAEFFAVLDDFLARHSARASGS